MDYLRQIEEDVRALSIEAKRKYPEVNDATDRALTSLKMMREIYISDMKKSADKNASLPQSPDISAPYILLCNHSDASSKLINLALNGIQILLNFGVVPPSDVKNILRVLSIQAAAKNEFQLKVLQILLQLANSLSSSAISSQYLTEGTVCSLLTLSLQLCDGKSNISVSSTALATARQIVALVMDVANAENSLGRLQREDETHRGDAGRRSSSVNPHASSTAQLLLRDLLLFSTCNGGEWIRGVLPPQTFALDLIYDILTEWPQLFRQDCEFGTFVKTSVCPTLKKLMKSLQEDFLLNCQRTNMSTAASLTARVTRIARLVLLGHLTPDIFPEADLIITLMVHTLQPNIGAAVDAVDVGATQNSFRSQTLGSFGFSFGFGSVDENRSTPVVRPLCEESKNVNSSNNPSSHANMMSRFQFQSLPGAVGGYPKGTTTSATAANTVLGAPSTRTLSSSVTGATGSTSSGTSNTVPQLALGRPGFVAQSTGLHYIPSHPAGCILETFLSFFLSDHAALLQTDDGLNFLSSSMISVAVSVSALLTSALCVDVNAKEFETTVRSSQLMSLLDGIVSGSEPDYDSVIRLVHEQLVAAPSIASCDVLVLAFHLLQVINRLLLKNCILASMMHQRSLTVTTTVHSTQIQTTTTARLKMSMTRVCDCLCESIQDASFTILSLVEFAAVIRRTVGLLAEIALSAGFLHDGRSCEVGIAALCKSAVPFWHAQDFHPVQAVLQGQSQLLLPQQVGGDDSGNGALRWRHVQASVRLFQTVHLLADVISDWDTVVDAFDQLVSYVDKTLSLVQCRSSQLMTAPAQLRQSHVDDDISIGEVEKMVDSIERFKVYTASISDESLVRLMTSLVTFSLNNLASGGSGSVSSSGPTGRSLYACCSTRDPNLGVIIPPYLVDGVNSGTVSFCLQAVIEIAKINSKRAPCIWQMVTSHLRMLASLKNADIRAIAVAATLDIVSTVLKQTRDTEDNGGDSGTRSDPSLNLNAKDADALSLAVSIDVSRIGRIITDDELFCGIFPPIDAVFQPYVAAQRNIAYSSSTSSSSACFPKLSQSDLLSALKALAAVRYDNVRIDVVSGLMHLLQGEGHNISPSGWSAILELLESVPASLVTCVEDSDVKTNNTAVANTTTVSVDNESTGVQNKVTTDGDADGTRSTKLSEESGKVPFSDTNEVLLTQGHSCYQWPKASLSIAFKAMKLIVDEFLETMSLEMFMALIISLSVYTEQFVDVNISLTSVEMLWKVADVALTRSSQLRSLNAAPDQRFSPQQPSSEVTIARDDGSFGVLEVMIRRLNHLSLDHRPEIRNCAINTLFSALTAAGTISTMSCEQWMKIFDDYIFPLLKSMHAVRTDKEVFAPELKRGVKMQVHHSRDTVQKQWSETRSLALRGLGRLWKSCIRTLTKQSWVRKSWDNSLDICLATVETAATDTEVAVAGIDVVFTMLKAVSCCSNKATVPPMRSETKSNQTKATQSQNSVGDPPGSFATAADVRESASEEAVRNDLWNSTWESVTEAATFDSPCYPFALHLIQQLASLHAFSMEGEFRYSANVKALLETIVLVCRPRVPPRSSEKDARDFRSDESVPSSSMLNSITSANGDRVAEMQLQRAAVILLKSISPVDSLSFLSLISALAEIVFGIRSVQIVSRFSESPIFLGPCPQKLRYEVGEYLLKILGKVSTTPTHDGDHSEETFGAVKAPRGISVALLDIILHRFLYDVCKSAVDIRCVMVDVPLVDIEHITPSKEEGANEQQSAGSSSVESTSGGGVGVFFSSLGKMLSAESSVATQHHFNFSTRKALAVSSLHKLEHVHIRQVESASKFCDVISLADAAPLFLLKMEFEVVATALHYCLPLVSEEDRALTDVLLRRIVTAVACCLTVWSPEECLILSDDHSYRSIGDKEMDGFLASMQMLFDSVFDLLGRPAVAAGAKSRLLEAIFNSARLMVCTLRDIEKLADCSEEKKAVAVQLSSALDIIMNRALTIMQHCADHCVTNILRKRALSGYISIVADLINAAAETAREPMSLLKLQLSSALSRLITVETSLSYLPLFSPQNESCQPRELMLAWLTGITFIHERVRSRSTDRKTCASSSTSEFSESYDENLESGHQPSDGLLTKAVQTKGHLLLLLPSLLRLLLSSSCDDELLRGILQKAISEIDSLEIVNSILRLSGKIEKLTSENNQISSELLSVRNAATLPF